jgi:hypothetical protein
MFMATSMGMQHAVDKLQAQIDVTLPWLQKWKLTPNTDKTLAIKFGRRGLKKSTPLKIYNQEISWKPAVKYLGVYLDSRLRFNRHVMETAQKARRTRAALYPVLNRLSPIPVRTKLSIYQMYVRTIITYAGLAWAALISNANWRRLEVVQNIAHRTITGSPWFVRNTVISKSSQIPSIQSTITQNSKNMFVKLQQPTKHSQNVRSTRAQQKQTR